MLSLNRWFGRGDSSGQVAKERLQRVLVQDRVNVQPDTMETVKQQILDTLSEFMEIDEKNSEVKINSSERTVSFTANIPIRKMKRATEAEKPEPEAPRAQPPARKSGKRGR